MRLIGTIMATEGENSCAFSHYLTSQGIHNECEKVLLDTGDQFRIWILEEDQVKRAEALLREYQTNPQDSRYHLDDISISKMSGFSPQCAEEPEDASPARRRRILSYAPYGMVTSLVLFLVVSFFLLALLQGEKSTPPQIPGVIQAPLLAPLEKVLIYDYPKYFEDRDQLLKIYPPEEFEKGVPPSSQANKLFQKMQQTPVWMGIYEKIIDQAKNRDQTKNRQFPPVYQDSLFEKIRKGEIWRIFTPALLHFDWLHLFFNVMWLLLLGNQIEHRLGWFRYLLLLLFIGTISNTAQYLMSGSFFMGLSGIVVGMAAFIWVRQKMAPWEGYLLERFTFIFLAIFVVGMFLLQLLFFIFQMIGTFEASIRIANTAHLTGGAVGYLLGRLRLFAISNPPRRTS